MAVVDYACSSCGLRAEKFFRAEAPDEIECPSCGAISKKTLSDFGFVFGDGKVPGNSGVDSLDRSLDKHIGRDAETRWEYVKDRNSKKREVRRDHGSGEESPLRMNSKGEYEPMQKKDSEKFQRLHKLGNEVIREGTKVESE